MKDGQINLSYIGTTYPTKKGGKLTVESPSNRRRGKNIIWNVSCSICSKDKELFPSGLFEGNKYQLDHGQVPCGCSPYKYNYRQNKIILARHKLIVYAETGDGKFLIHDVDRRVCYTATKSHAISGFSVEPLIPKLEKWIKPKPKKFHYTDLVGQSKTLGNGSVITIIGADDKPVNKTRYYDCVCSVCSLDKELYPKPFRTTKTNLFYNDCAPCGCFNTRINKSKVETEILALRASRSLGNKLVLINFPDGEPTSFATVVQECPIHGEWETSLATLMRGCGCVSCHKGGGYISTKVGYLYILKHHEENRFKVGISNYPDKRIAGLRRTTPFNFSVVALYSHVDGRLVHNVETAIHRMYEKSGYSGFDGSREWLNADMDILNAPRELGLKLT